ncbi:S41 family peptidase [Tistrella bauzanensis]|uniref:S41 family peptidase n=1 Tax=Tistrella arctica TaxID=3133430 RepID=A0ABU9YJU0_9PROT
MRRGFVTGLVSLVVLSLPLVGSAANRDSYNQLNLFGEVFERIRRDYVEPVDDAKLIEAAINGMLQSLDPHSSYLDGKAYRDMQVQTRGEFGGLGIEVTMDTQLGLVRVISPIDGSPADKAGVQPNDLIVAIDGEQVQGLTLADAVERMRGPAGSTIVVTLRREGAPKEFDVTITRAVIPVDAVRVEPKGSIGYVRLRSFNERTDEQLEDGIEKLRREIGGPMTGLVLDLRNNPGGLLDQAVAVSDSFLERGEIVSTRGRDQNAVQRFQARGGDVVDGMPMVVLINGGSASASEIVAGALQDHGRAVVLGTKSFGKGSVQTLIPLPGHGAMRLTTSRYYTPSGRSIQAKGIEPDILVEQAIISPSGAVVKPRSEADLRGHLENDQEPAASPADAVPAEAKPDGPVGTVPGEGQPGEGQPGAGQPGTEPAPDGGIPPAAIGTAPTPGSQEDYQLQRALELLRGVALFSRPGSSLALNR